MHGFIWNYPSRFSALCQKAPLKILGGHPVDVFASLEAHEGYIPFNGHQWTPGLISEGSCLEEMYVCHYRWM